MSITARILTGFLILSIAGVTIFLGLVGKRIGQAYREATEEPMVDAAETLAALISQELKSSGQVGDRWKDGFRAAHQRLLHAQIYGRLKTRISMNLYVTDEKGIVQFDSGNPANAGHNFAAFRDVAMTLQGQYGARTTRQGDQGWFLYVAAPILVQDRLRGVVTIYKAQRDLDDFLADTEKTLLLLGLGVISASTIIGVALSRWVTAPLSRLTRHAIAIARGERPSPPQLPGKHLRILGESLEQMRDALEGRKYVQAYVQTLSHEMKAPVAAIGGAADLLLEEMPADRRTRFLTNIQTESSRLQRLINELLALSVLENRKKLEAPERIELSSITKRQIERASGRVSSIEFVGEQSLHVLGDEFLIESAVANLLQNAVEFSPPNGKIVVSIAQTVRTVRLSILDEGPGIPGYAIDKIFDRFYSLARPSSGKRSSGLGLCFVREVAHLHRGSVTVGNRTDHRGVEAVLLLEVAPD